MFKMERDQSKESICLFRAMAEVQSLKKGRHHTHTHMYTHTRTVSLSLHQCVMFHSSLQKHIKLNSLLILFSKRPTSIFPSQSRHCVYTCACPYVCAFVFHNAVQHFSFWHKSPAPLYRREERVCERRRDRNRWRNKERTEIGTGKKGDALMENKRKEKKMRLTVEIKLYDREMDVEVFWLVVALC